MTTKRKTPQPSRPLGASGRKLWRDVWSKYDLEHAEPALLQLACELVDRADELEAAIERDGLMVAGSTGQRRLNPAVAEIRQTRLAVARCLGGLDFPTRREAGAMSISDRNRQNAMARWRRTGA